VIDRYIVNNVVIKEADPREIINYQKKENRKSLKKKGLAGLIDILKTKGYSVNTDTMTGEPLPPEE
jgi:hypothetical protein